MYTSYFAGALLFLFASTSYGQNDSAGIIEESKAVSESPAQNREHADSMDKANPATDAAQEHENAGMIDPVSAGDDKKTDTVSYCKGNFNDIDLLKADAKQLRELSEKLYKKSESLEDESEDLDKAIEELEDKADDLEDQAEELLKQAGYIQSCIAITKDAQKSLLSDSIEVPGDSVIPDDRIHDQKILMLKMRNSADELLIKTKNIALKIRKMREDADSKTDISDKLDDKAEELDAKARELEEAAEYLQEQQNMAPFSARHPFKLGHQIRIAAVPPFDDDVAHILFLSGLTASYFFTDAFNVGLEDITLRFQETIYGKRTGICVSVGASYSYFVAHRFELGFGGGLAVQGQVGAERGSKVALAPFIKLFNENWVSKRFSIGPVLKVNYLATGSLFARVYPFDRPRVLPQGAVWLDFGLAYAFHF